MHLQPKGSAHIYYSIGIGSLQVPPAPGCTYGQLPRTNTPEPCVRYMSERNLPLIRRFLGWTKKRVTGQEG